MTLNDSAPWKRMEQLLFNHPFVMLYTLAARPKTFDILQVHAQSRYTYFEGGDTSIQLAQGCIPFQSKYLTMPHVSSDLQRFSRDGCEDASGCAACGLHHKTEMLSGTVMIALVSTHLQM